MKGKGTVIRIDLSEELSAEELKSFRREAKKAKAKSLKEHFMAINFGTPKSAA